MWKEWAERWSAGAVASTFRWKWAARRSIALLSLALVLTPAFASAQTKPDPDPARFAQEIDAFVQSDTKNSTPRDAVLFAGSSSIRFWPTADRFPSLPVINRGFGGSHISDVNHFIEQTVLKYRPAGIVFYAGDNDINDGKTPERVAADFATFATRVFATRADTQILFVTIKPSRARWEKWPAMDQTNQLVAAYAKREPRVHVVDVGPRMLGADGTPRADLLRDDGLHMTPAGYDIWTEMVGRAIDEVRKVPAGAR